jgi:hypothetical protein
MFLPQELIDKIILESDNRTIIQNRNILSNYAILLSYKKNIIDMIKDNDIEALNYNKTEIQHSKEYVFNKIIIHSEYENVEDLLNWAYANEIYPTMITIKLLLLIDNNINKLKTILNVMYNNNYKFSIYHYLFGIEWRNITLLKFLLEKNINYYNYAEEITKSIIKTRNIELIEWSLNNNLIQYYKMLICVFLTGDKIFIKKIIRITPLTIIHWAIKKMKKENFNKKYIIWCLLITLSQEHNIFDDEILEIYKTLV